MSKTIIADLFAETLHLAGVERIYGVVGDSLNGLTDSLRRQGKIEWIHVRNEEAAAFAAGAEAQLTGQKFRIAVWDSARLQRAIFENYDALPAAIKADLPLRRAWVLAE